jgi:hypothetical protein
MLTVGNNTALNVLNFRSSTQVASFSPEASIMVENTRFG